MRVKIRLYRPHDMDLIALKRTESYRLGTEMKRCLIAYATGAIYTPPNIDSHEVPEGYVGKTYQMHIELNPKKEEERAAISVLEGIHPGYRCAFIKALFRSNCVYLPLLIFSDNKIVTSKLDAFYKMTKNMNESQPEVNVREIGQEKEERKEELENKKEVESEPLISEPTIQTSNDELSEDTNSEDDFDTLFGSFSSLG